MQGVVLRWCALQNSAAVSFSIHQKLAQNSPCSARAQAVSHMGTAAPPGGPSLEAAGGSSAQAAMQHGRGCSGGGASRCTGPAAAPQQQQAQQRLAQAWEAARAHTWHAHLQHAHSTHLPDPHLGAPTAAHLAHPYHNHPYAWRTHTLQQLHCGSCIIPARTAQQDGTGMAPARPLHHARLHPQQGHAYKQVHPADAARTTPLHGSVSIRTPRPCTCSSPHERHKGAPHPQHPSQR
jgi:hypothetical protein